MSEIKFQFVGDTLTGPGLSFDVAELTGLADEKVKALREKLLEIAHLSYLEGRSRILPSWDDRFDLHRAVSTLRGLAAIVDPHTAERHQRAAAILAQLLQEQES